MDKSNKHDIIEIFRQRELVKICAPMVRYTKLQFRTLVRSYDSDICYTPMILADSFCQSQKARNNEFTTNKGDTPLVVQFAAKTVHDFVGAAQMIVPYSDGVELNCGCPQRWALHDGYGCAMLKQPELLADLIKQCRSYMPTTFTVSAKIRLLNDIRKTIELCKKLENCGISYIVVHGRTPTQRSESVNVEALREIKQSIRVPLVANGDVKTLSDAARLKNSTNCDGVMVARGLLTNPALFSGHETTPLECVQKWVDICYNSVLNKSDNDRSSCRTVPIFPERHSNLTFQCFHHHLVFMLEKILNKKQRQIFNNLQRFEDVLEFLKENLQIIPKIFEDDLFYNNQLIKTNYVNGNYDLYLKLKKLHNEGTNEVKARQFDSENTAGHFFSLKIKNCDEDEDGEAMSSLFEVK